MGKYKPFKNLGPGHSIRREMEANGWNQKDLADILGFSEKHVSRLLNNKEPITLNTAKLLSSALGGTPQFWVNLDTNYRLRLEATAEETATAARALIYRYMPVRDMRAKGWLPKENDKLMPAVKKFWGIKELKFDFIEAEAAACFRKSDLFLQFNQFYALTWLKKARDEAEKITVNKYSLKKLEELAKSIPELSTLSNGMELFIDELKECGVKFLQIPHLEKTYIDGASFMDSENPVVVYTARHNRIDNFWFTVTHEIAHVLKHLQSSLTAIIDNMDDIDTSTEREQEADAFTSDILKNTEILEYFQGIRRKTKEKIIECSNCLKIAPAIIIGCLQHHKEMPYSSMREFLVSTQTK